jgi:ATP-dependent RNA helicase SUPV3L1/SUV3
MFRFNSTPKAEAAAPAPVNARQVETHPLDGLTGGAFSAATSGERAARIREWLATDPPVEQMQDVFRELSGKDKGAAKALREKLDDIKRAKGQALIAVEWAAKAQALLDASRLNIADAMAWQRDAARAGAPLSREPLSLLKQQLADRVKAIEDLQHRVQVHREAAVLLAQRIEVLSMKPIADAHGVVDGLRTDVALWAEHAAGLSADAGWASVDARFPPLLDASGAQLQAVWGAFDAALAQAMLALVDAGAPLPPVMLWAEEIRAQRGVPSADAASAEPAAPRRPKVDPEQRAQANAVVREAVDALEKELTEGHGKASTGAANALRQALKDQGAFIDKDTDHKAHAALNAAGELEGWQRWSADQHREQLLQHAESLLNRPTGQALGGRKMQESIKALREQWKLLDKSSSPNHGMWRRFDEACTRAHKVVEAWLDKIRAEAAVHRTQRMDIIEELKAWAPPVADAHGHTDWKAFSRAVFQFEDRWRDAGHVGEKAFAEMQPLWKEAMKAAVAPLDQARRASVERREALIAEAQRLGAVPQLRIDAVKALQQRWQAEALTVPLDRKLENRLWDAFRKPIDDAFQRKTAERETAQAALSVRDRAVLAASNAVDKANASGDAQQIRIALAALEMALNAQPTAEPVAAVQPAQSEDNKSTPAQSDKAPDAIDFEPSADAPTPTPAPAPVKTARPVMAMRGDDRPGARRDVPAPAPMGRGRDGDRRPGRPGGEMGGRPDRLGAERERWAPRGAGGDAPPPRLGDEAFRAQRQAMENAQAALRKLASQAHGEVLINLMTAWEHRDASALPSGQDLGRQVAPTVRSSWVASIAQAPAATPATEALLRLEMAAEVPTPAGELDARRQLQLQMLTRRNDPPPAQTWGADTARVLASGYNDAQARRLQNVLKVLLRR